jgi:hypothetical protein
MKMFNDAFHDTGYSKGHIEIILATPGCNKLKTSTFSVVLLFNHGCNSDASTRKENPSSTRGTE